MRRIIVNCLLLAIVSATPSRNPRHLSYIKDFITSSLFGTNERSLPGYVSPEPDIEYKYYKVPGFNDLIVKTIPNEQKTVYQPRQDLKLSPFETYIGTNSPGDTLVAFQNVNNLLSTKILNEQQTSSLKEVLVPLISDLDTVKIVTEDVIPVRIVPETEQAETKVQNPFDVNVNLEDKIPKYTYKQVENNVPIMVYSSDDNSDVSVVERIDRTPALPMCVRQRINDVISLGANPYFVPPIVVPTGYQQVVNEQYPYVIHRFLPSDEPLKNNVHASHSNHKNPVNVIKNKDEVKTHITKPPWLHHNVPPSENKSTIAKNNKKQVVNGNKIVKTQGKETLSEYIHEREIHDKIPAVSIAREKDRIQIHTHPNFQLPNSNIFKPHIHMAPILTHPKTIKPVFKIPEKGTLSYYIYEHVNHNHPAAFSLFKDGDEQRTNPHRFISVPNYYLNILTSPHRVISPHTVINTVKTEKPLNKIVNTEKVKPFKKTIETPTINNPKDHISYNSSNVNGMLKEEEELKTAAHTVSPISTTNIAPVNYSTIKENFTNKNTVNSESTTESISAENIKENASALNEDTTISLKNNPIVVTDDKFIQDEDLTTSKIEVDEDEDFLDNNFTKGRGDIQE